MTSPSRSPTPRSPLASTVNRTVARSPACISRRLAAESDCVGRTWPCRQRWASQPGPFSGRICHRCRAGPPRKLLGCGVRQASRSQFPKGLFQTGRYGARVPHAPVLGEIGTALWKSSRSPGIQRNMTTKESPEPCRYRFFLGGMDLEMATIRELLERHAPGCFEDKRLGWENAEAARYAQELRAAHARGEIPVLVELRGSLPTDLARQPMMIVVGGIGVRVDLCPGSWPRSISAGWVSALHMTSGRPREISLPEKPNGNKR
jgi:hypothetical protein